MPMLSGGGDGPRFQPRFLPGQTGGPRFGQPDPEGAFGQKPPVQVPPPAIDPRRLWRQQRRAQPPAPVRPAVRPPVTGTPQQPPPGGGQMPVNPFVPAPAPGGPMPGPGGGGWPPMGMPGGPLQMGSAPPGPGDFNDPFSLFLSAVPAMNANRDRQIGDAMANAGFSGNRFGTFAAERAAQVGAENSLQQNALLSQILYNYANDTQNRALSSAGMGLQAAGLQDQMAMNRFMVPAQLGQWEQGRQDDFSKMRYEDFERNKLGWFPMLLQAAMSQGAGSPGQIYQTTTQPAQPGIADWIGLLGSLFG